jgi:hypothetical protein
VDGILDRLGGIATSAMVPGESVQLGSPASLGGWSNLSISTGATAHASFYNFSCSGLTVGKQAPTSGDSSSARLTAADGSSHFQLPQAIFNATPDSPGCVYGLQLAYWPQSKPVCSANMYVAKGREREHDEES